MASQFKELVEAIVQTEGQLVANRFSEEDLKKLWGNGYQAAVDLQSATRESLLEIGLPRARVDALIGTSVAGMCPLLALCPSILADPTNPLLDSSRTVVFQKMIFSTVSSLTRRVPL
jgi:hypothetical protein